MVSPSATIATTTLTPGLFHVFFDRGAATSAILALNFVDSIGTLGPVSTTTLDFSAGGSGSGGDNTQLPPPPPGVTVTITAGLTGEQTGSLNGESVSFTNNQSVTVQATASASYGAISDLVVVTSDGQTIDLGGASGSSFSTTTSVSLPSEGRIELTAQATVANSGLSASGMTSQPVVLLVDRTPPTLNFILAGRYRPTGSSPTDPPPPLRHGLSDDADLVLLNGNGNADNAPLRDQRGMNVFDKAGFTLDAEIVDATGPSAGSLAGTAKSETSLTRPLTVTIVRSAAANAPALIEATGFGALDESIEYDSQYLSATTFRGRWTVGLDITDRAGNRLNADQLKAWVDTKPPAAQFGRILYQQQFGYQGFANGQYGVGVSPARWIVTTADAAEVWQDSVDDANRLPCLVPPLATLPHSTGSRLLGWQLKTPANVPNTGQSDAVTVVVRDFCGNLASARTLRTTLQVMTLPDPSPGQRVGLSGYGSSGGSPISDQPVARLSPASPMDDTMTWLFGICPVSPAQGYAELRILARCSPAQRFGVRSSSAGVGSRARRHRRQRMSVGVTSAR